MSEESNIEKLVGVATLPPSLIPALWNIGILLHKQAKWRTVMNTTVNTVLPHIVSAETIFFFEFIKSAFLL